jgi:hypothetical protein
VSINFTISYTFSPGTTISSSQVNTNFSDEANVWIGLEALTKSFSNLRVDTTPTTSTDVAIKSYVDKLNAYRRPVLQFGSVTTVAVESGLDGTSGDIPLLFPDGTLRTETSTTRTTFDITRNAVLVTSGAQSGLTGATSEATNTWYALYGCKVTDSSTLWVTVGSTVLPLRANFATLNTAYGTNGWVYLGMIRNGDNNTATGDILAFSQAGNLTLFRNSTSGGASDTTGFKVAATGGATTLTYTYSAGTGTTDVPNHILMGIVGCGIAAGSGTSNVNIAAATLEFGLGDGTHAYYIRPMIPITLGVKLSNGSSVAMEVFFAGFVDGVLGIGANPVL